MNHERTEVIGSNHIDPVRGMTVDPSTAAVKGEFRDQTYCFCSVGCAEKFHTDPSAYVTHAKTRKQSQGLPAEQSQPSTGSANRRTLYTCPMHPEVQQRQESL